MIFTRTLYPLLIAFISLFNVMDGSDTYKRVVLEKMGEVLPEFSQYPSFHFPNKEYQKVLPYFPESKILLFGYGSLMNKYSAAKNMKPEAVASMQPAVAFGVKRIFNYQAKKTEHWGKNQDSKEKAMLNLVPCLNPGILVNGVIMEIDEEDLVNLIGRERGYDLVPILIALWDSVSTEDPDVEIKVAYTFMAPYEPRDSILYTSNQFYPVRGYLHAVQEGALEFGSAFAEFWDMTTYLADCKTSIREWDQETFQGILCAKQIIDT